MKPLIDPNAILLGQKTVSKEDSIRAAGMLLNRIGCVDPSYIDSMLLREQTVSACIGYGIAIPHGMAEAKDTVKKTGIVMLQYPQGVAFGPEPVQLVFGLAGAGDDHLILLSRLSVMLSDPGLRQRLKTTSDQKLAYQILLQSLSWI